MVSKLIMCFHCAPISENIFNKLKHADVIVTCTKGYQNKILSKIAKDSFLMPHAFKVNEEIDFTKKETLMLVS